MRVLRGLLTVSVFVYGALLSLALLARLVYADSGPLMALFTTGAHLLLLGAVLLFPVALLLARPRWVALVLVPPMAVFFYHYADQFFPGRSSPAREGTTEVRVMTYNMQWRSGDYADSIAVIREADADIVALQEVSLEAGASLEAGLRDLYPHMALAASENGYAGAAVLSRYPILEDQYFTAAFGSQRVVLEIATRPLVLYNMHLATPITGSLWRLNPARRSAEVRSLLDAVAAEREPVVVAGDFNLTDLTDDYARLRAVLTDSYRETGWGMGWTHPGPLVVSRPLVWLRMLRIDYVFTGPGGVRPVSAVVWQDSGGSDHLPVIATIEVFDPSASYAAY